MRKFVITAVALAAVSVAAPSFAQSHHRPAPHAVSYGSWQSINARQANLDRRIDQGVRTGQLSRREATSCARSSTACCVLRPTTAAAA